MGGLVFVGRARLRGVPFMSGFYSKDLFLELARNTRILGGREIIFCYSACALTCGYSLRAAWALMGKGGLLLRAENLDTRRKLF